MFTTAGGLWRGPERAVRKIMKYYRPYSAHREMHTAPVWCARCTRSDIKTHAARVSLVRRPVSRGVLDRKSRPQRGEAARTTRVVILMRVHIRLECTARLAYAPVLVCVCVCYECVVCARDVMCELTNVCVPLAF